MKIFAVVLALFLLVVAFLYGTVVIYDAISEPEVGMTDNEGLALNKKYFQIFSDSVVKKDPKIFYDSFAPKWRAATTPEKVREVFASVYDDGRGFSTMMDKFPNEAEISTRGTLTFVKTAIPEDLDPERFIILELECGYEFTKGEWRLLSFDMVPRLGEKRSD